MNRRPNILFIMSDQHNAKVLGHKGHPDVKTPNLDRLVAEGVRFDNAITQSPICTPSRVSFLSGQYCHNHGYYSNWGPEPVGLPNIMGHFRGAGYSTAAIGKLDCPDNWIEGNCDYFRQTIDYYRGKGGSPEYNEYLKKRGVWEDRDYGFYPEQPQKINQSLDGRASRLKYEDSPEGWIVREAIGFMDRSRTAGKPFFVHASLPHPHQIYAPSEPFWSMYDESNLHLPPNAEYDLSLKSPELRKKAKYYKTGDWTLFEPRTFEAGRLRKLHGYLGCVSQVDYAVGEMLSWLKKSGLEENTIVIYTTDHGDYACEHGMMEKTPGICSDAITRIPFIWRWPGKFKAGYVVKEIVEAVDLSTTLCSLAGLEEFPTGDGKDISHLLRGERGDVHKIGVTESVWSKSVRKGKYRYVYYPQEMFAEEYPNGFGELYNLDKDPWEMENLYFKTEYEPVVQELKDYLIDWLITTTRVVHGGAVSGNGKVRHRIIKDPKRRSYL